MEHDPKTFHAALVRGAAAAGIELTADQLAAAERHARLLAEWNAKTNLTAITDPEVVARRHFLEAFMVAPLLEWPGPSAAVLDVGSGAGFPGLAARIVAPALRLTLVEPDPRKAAFLSAVAAQLPPPPIRVLPRTLANVPRGTTFDVITFRAVKLRAEELIPLLAPNGRLVMHVGSAGHLPIQGVLDAVTVAELPTESGRVVVQQLRAAGSS